MGTGFWLERDPDSVLGAEFAFVRADRSVETDHFYPGPPDLAVEVISWSNPASTIAEKTARWLDAGVRAVVVVDSEAETVAVHRASGVAHADAVLAVDDVLPGWRLAVAEIFE